MAGKMLKQVGGRIYEDEREVLIVFTDGSRRQVGAVNYEYRADIQAFVVIEHHRDLVNKDEKVVVNNYYPAHSVQRFEYLGTRRSNALGQG